MPKPLDIEVTGTYVKREGNYKARAAYGPNLAMNVAGKYNLVGGQKPISGDVEVEVLTPNDKYKSMKAQASGSMLLPQEDGHVEVIFHSYLIIYLM